MSKRPFLIGAVVTAFFVFQLLFFAPHAAASTTVAGAIVSSTTWTVSGSPYVIAGVVVPVGVTLTIDPGVVVKFTPGSVTNLAVLGTLQVNGTPENKVYFTSLYDDSIGGDTNGDGKTTVPTPGQWGNITFSAGSVGNFDSAAFYYGGYSYSSCTNCNRSNIVNVGGMLALANVEVASSTQYGIWQSSGSATITGSEVHNVPYGYYGTKGSIYISNTNFHDISSAGVYASAGDVSLIHNDFNRVATAGIIAPSTNFIHASNAATGGVNNGFAFDGTLTTDQTLVADLPYVVSGLVIPFGRTLTLNEGVIIKFGIGYVANLTVNGNLVVNGKTDNKIYFTSLYDDAVGGDTNGDGAGQTPGPGQWGSVVFNAGSTGSLSSTVIRYGGYTYSGCPSCYVTNIRNNGGTLSFDTVQLASSSWYGMYQNAGTSTIASSEFNNQLYGVYINRGTAAVASSSFHNNTNAALVNNTVSPIVATNNWWGDASGPKVATNPGGLGQSFAGNVLFDPWTGKYTNAAPVLQFLAGDTDGVSTSTIWLPTQPVFSVVYSDVNNDPPVNLNVVINNVPHSMRLTNNTPSFATKTTYIFTPPTGTFGKGDYTFYFEGSDGQVTTTLQTDGQKFVVKNRPVILVPGILGSEQKDGVWVIDPILHTYDNLLDTFRANGFVDNVDLFPFPYDWHQSNVLTAYQLHQKIDAIKSICACDKVNIVAHSMGGLVSRQYIQSDYFENDVDQLIFLGTPHLGSPEAYLTWEGGEIGVGILSGLKEFVFKREAKKYGFSGIYDYVRNYAVSAQQLLPNYDYIREQGTNLVRVYPNNYPRNVFLENLSGTVEKLYSSGVRITNIVGDQGGDSTINFIRVVNSTLLPLWENGYPNEYNKLLSDRGLEQGNGDGTVPLVSSQFIKDGLLKINSEHADLPDKAKSIVIESVSGILQPTTVDSIHLNNYKLLIIKILSPADIVVVAPDGKRVGKDFELNQEVNEIEGAFYSGFVTDNEFVAIPNPLDGQYVVEAKGTGNGGEYTIATGLISSSTVAEGDVSSTILPNQIKDTTVVVNNTTSTSVEVLPMDIFPPIITVASPVSSTYLHSSFLPVTVSTTDTDSGVASQETLFDGTIVVSTTVIDLFFTSLGNHRLSIFAADGVGNMTTASVQFAVITSPSSTIADVKRAYTLGWITNRNTRNALIKSMNSIIRLEKKIEWVEEKFSNKPKVLKRVEKYVERVDKILGRKLVEYLEKELQKKHITQQGFDMLNANITWLINN